MTEAKRMGFGGSFGRAKEKNPNVIVTEEREIGNVEKGFEEADKLIEYTVTRGMNSPAGVEAMACVAQWRGDFSTSGSIISPILKAISALPA